MTVGEMFEIYIQVGKTLLVFQLLYPAQVSPIMHNPSIYSSQIHDQKCSLSDKHAMLQSQYCHCYNRELSNLTHHENCDLAATKSQENVPKLLCSDHIPNKTSSKNTNKYIPWVNRFKQTILKYRLTSELSNKPILIHSYPPPNEKILEKQLSHQTYLLYAAPLFTRPGCNGF